MENWVHKSITVSAYNMVKEGFEEEHFRMITTPAVDHSCNTELVVGEGGKYWSRGRAARSVRFVQLDS